MEMISIVNIKAKSSYLRLDTDVESLKKSITMIGLIHPLTINKQHELIAGGRRFTALKELGYKEVPVNIIENDPLEQELVSIDENLVRKPLTGLEVEVCLNRGREIYEKLNPEANIISVELSDNVKKTKEEKQLEKMEEENDHTSFAAITAEKTGLSKSSIKLAIKRDELASADVKAARDAGIINASQTNEIIKLTKDEQDQMLPHLENRPVKQVKAIVGAVISEGVKNAINLTNDMETMPSEFDQLRKMTKKISRHLSKMILEELTYNGDEAENIIKEVKDLKKNLNFYLKLQGDDVSLMEVDSYMVGSNKKPMTHEPHTNM
jgi:ParB family chromosome partitioning protein